MYAVKTNRNSATVVRGVSMHSDLAEKIDVRMGQLGITSFSQYIQLLVRRDVTEGGPIQIHVLPALSATDDSRPQHTPNL